MVTDGARRLVMKTTILIGRFLDSHLKGFGCKRHTIFQCLYTVTATSWLSTGQISDWNRFDEGLNLGHHMGGALVCPRLLNRLMSLSRADLSG